MGQPALPGAVEVAVIGRTPTAWFRENGSGCNSGAAGATSTPELPLDMGETGITFWTVGHSNRSTAEFLQVLVSADIELIADVRRFPGSRRHPQFSSAQLTATLNQQQIQYLHLSELGGRRRTMPNAPANVWRNQSFKAYADYMQTSKFHTGIARLLSLATTHRTCIMCAEALWWRCHRALIADAVSSIQTLSATTPRPLRVLQPSRSVWSAAYSATFRSGDD